VDVRNARCAYPGCKAILHFEEAGEKRGEYCKSHALDEMESIHARCAVDGCGDLASWGHSRNAVSMCGDHRKRGHRRGYDDHTPTRSRALGASLDWL
jgi:hypothetical protein